MTEIEEMIDLRRRAVRQRNRSASIMKIIASLMVLALVLHLLVATIIPATLFDVVQIIASTAALVLIWFYSSTERYHISDVAGGLAGDLLIWMATQIRRYGRFEPASFMQASHGPTGFSRAIVSLSTPRGSIMDVATRIAEHRVAQKTGLRIKDGKFPRLSSITEEYRFTAQDMKEIIMAMHHDREAIEAYQTVIELIGLSIGKRA